MIGYLVVGVLILTMVFIMGLISLSNTTNDWAVVLVVMFLCIGIGFIILQWLCIETVQSYKLPIKVNCLLDLVVIYKKGDNCD